jgi:uncharacterized caspase-like protein
MNLSKSTNQQLYQIAFDKNARLKDRYAAARELQERRKAHEIRRNRSKH